MEGETNSDPTTHDKHVAYTPITLDYHEYLQNSTSTTKTIIPTIGIKRKYSEAFLTPDSSNAGASSLNSTATNNMGGQKENPGENEIKIPESFKIINGQYVKNRGYYKLFFCTKSGNVRYVGKNGTKMPTIIFESYKYCKFFESKNFIRPQRLTYFEYCPMNKHHYILDPTYNERRQIAKCPYNHDYSSIMRNMKIYGMLYYSTENVSQKKSSKLEKKMGELEKKIGELTAQRDSLMTQRDQFRSSHYHKMSELSLKAKQINALKSRVIFYRDRYEGDHEYEEDGLDEDGEIYEHNVCEGESGEVYEGREREDGAVYEGREREDGAVYEGRERESGEVYEGRERESGEVYEGRERESGEVYEGRERESGEDGEIYEARERESGEVYEGRERESGEDGEIYEGRERESGEVYEGRERESGEDGEVYEARERESGEESNIENSIK